MTVEWLELQGTANTRDLGGIATATGEIASGVVLRSDNLQDLTPADVALLAELPVTLVIDLRTPGEVEAEGPTPLDAAGIPRVTLSMVPDPDAAMRGEGRILPDRTGKDPAETYLNYLGEMPANVVEAVRLIARNEGTTIIQCAAGKDRTGTLAALMLDAVGAERAAVIDDYLITGERVAAVITRLSRRPVYAPDLTDSEMKRHIPIARTMTVVLDTLDADWGGAAGWLIAHGLTQDDLTALRQRLTPGAP